MNRDLVNFWAFWVGVALAFMLLAPQARASVTYFQTDCGAGVQQGSAQEIASYICANINICMGGAFSQGSYSRHEILASSPRTLKSYCNYYAFGNWTYDGLATKDAYEFTVSECPAGLVEDGGVCRQPNVCDETAGQTVSSGLYDLGTDPEALPPTTTCDGQCELSYTGSGVVTRQLVGGVWHYFAEGSYTRVASACSGSTAIDGAPALPPPSCDPATQDQGTVNGRFVCLPRETTKTTTESPPVTNPDGSTTQTTTTDNGDGTQDITVTVTMPDGTKTVTTTTAPAPNSDNSFCEANPTHDSCRKDDIPWGEIPEAGLIPVHEVETSTAYDVMGGEGQCPADQTVSFLGQSITWSYAPICTFAQAIRPLVIGLSWLSFGLILVGGLGRAK